MNIGKAEIVTKPTSIFIPCWHLPATHPDTAYTVDWMLRKGISVYLPVTKNGSTDDIRVALWPVSITHCEPRTKLEHLQSSFIHAAASNQSCSRCGCHTCVVHIQISIKTKKKKGVIFMQIMYNHGDECPGCFFFFFSSWIVWNLYTLNSLNFLPILCILYCPKTANAGSFLIENSATQHYLPAHPFSNRKWSTQDQISSLTKWIYRGSLKIVFQSSQ